MRPDHRLDVDLYVRADTPTPDHRETVTETFDRLAADGHITDWTVHLWPRAVPLDPLGDRETSWVPSLYHAFRAWATRADVTLAPAFAVRTTTNLLGETGDRRLHLPVECLAVYAAQDLLALYPVTVDGTVLTVADGLDRLETLPPDTDPGTHLDPRPTDPRHATEDRR